MRHLCTHKTKRCDSSGAVPTVASYELHIRLRSLLWLSVLLLHGHRLWLHQLHTWRLNHRPSVTSKAKLRPNRGAACRTDGGFLLRELTLLWASSAWASALGGFSAAARSDHKAASNRG